MIYLGSLGFLLLIVGAISLLLVIILLLKPRPTSYYFFAGELAIISYSILLLAAIQTKWILEVPFIFQTGSPLHYLVGPLTYFFILTSLKPGYKFSAIDLLHFLPATLHLAESLPFYFTSNEEKRILLLSAYESAGVLNSKFGSQVLSYFQHLFLKCNSIIIYSILGFRLIYNNFKNSMASFRNTNMIIYQWATLDVALKFLVGAGGVVKSIYWSNQITGVEIFFSATLIFDSLVGFGFILLNPKILEGVRPYQLNTSVEEIKIRDEKLNQKLEAGETDSQTETIKIKDEKKVITDYTLIETFFQSEKPFLNENLSREMMAESLAMNTRRITSAIKHGSNLSFTDYINRYRIHYLEQKATQSPDWKKYSLDAIANEIGFSNRITFYHAVKRHKNITPSELLKSIGLGERI